MDQKSPLKFKRRPTMEIENAIYKTHESLESNIKRLENAMQHSIKSSFDDLADRFKASTDQIKSAASQLKQPIKKALDIPEHTRNSPYVTVCSAFAIGAAIGAKSFSKTKKPDAIDNKSSLGFDFAKELALQTTKTFLNMKIEQYLRNVMEAESGGSDGT